MDFLKKIGSWADELTKIGISIVALGVVLEVLFKGAEIPFWPNVSVVDNINNHTVSFTSLSSHYFTSS